MSTSPAKDRTGLPGALGAEYAAEDEHRPLGGYAVLTCALGAQDPLLAGIATYKVSRLITKDKIASVRS
jgi:hypothetical protein